MLFTLVAGAAFLHELALYSRWSILPCVLGALMTLIGLFMLTYSQEAYRQEAEVQLPGGGKGKGAALIGGESSKLLPTAADEGGVCCACVVS